MSKRRIAWVVITAVAGLATLVAGRQIWVAPPGSLEPPANLLPLFIALAVLESVLFGLGLCFLVFGYRLLARAGQPLWLTYGAYLATAWLLVSWWPHDNLHRINRPGDWVGLLRIDYLFHLTLMASAVMLAIFFFRVLRQSAERA